MTFFGGGFPSQSADMQWHILSFMAMTIRPTRHGFLVKGILFPALKLTSSCGGDSGGGRTDN